ncbi:STAS domain-containing protein [Streptomyces sp. NBC_01216]|uniref:STAS domain-containing protein n=1 Tax=unclassified Streptomyces TaxID=2593676 RepID=UPI002E15187E|nr:STAS domain-containing protein [Streptomyces sp. NBC_01216]
MTTTLIALEVTGRTESTAGAVLSGELDIHTTAHVEPDLVDLIGTGAREIVLDLSALTFCDSSGIDLFVKMHRRAGEAGSRLRLTRVPALIGHSFHVLGADRVVALK